MKIIRMGKTILLGAVFVISGWMAGFSGTVYAAEAITPVEQSHIQKILTNWRARYGIPGATLSIYMPGYGQPVTFASGETTFRGAEKVKDNTLFQAGSITKSFTSTIILKLESEGKLKLNDSITKYLPQYPQWNQVTIRQLLNHTSGIFNYTDTGTFNHIRKTNPQAEFTPKELVNIAEQHHNYFHPGNGWKYSNTNYVLAGMIIEKVTGKPINEVMNYYLHRGGLRLKLENTHYASGIYTRSFLTRMAHGYSPDGQDATYDNMSWAYTAGAMVTTTDDLLRWWHGIFQGNILPPRQLAEMKSLVCDGYSPGCKQGKPIYQSSERGSVKGYGLGIIQTGTGSEKIGRVWWHNGSTRGYRAIVMWFPKRDIYMALAVSRYPGHKVNPNLPVIRNVMNVLVPRT